MTRTIIISAGAFSDRSRHRNPAPDDVGRRRVGVDFELNVGKVERVPKRARWLLRRQRD
jgi:hypothetical protein